MTAVETAGLAIAQAVEWLTTSEVARTLGVAPETVRRWCQDETIPAVQIGTHWRIAKGWLDAKLERVRPFLRRKR